MDIQEWRGRLEDPRLLTSPDPVVQRMLGAAFYLLGEDSRAAWHYRAALAADPSDWASMGGLAALFATGIVGLDEAERLLARALQIAPAEWRLVYNMGAIYVAQREYAKAITALEEALALAPDAEKDKIRERLRSLSQMPSRGAGDH